MWELSFIEIKPLWVGIPLRRLSVDHKDSRDLRELSENDLVFIFNPSHDTILKEVSISLIFLVLGKL